MTTIDEARVEAHYTRENLLSTIRDGLTAAGFDPDSPDASALSAVDASPALRSPSADAAPRAKPA